MFVSISAKKHLVLSFIAGPKMGQKYTFKTDKTVRIGRNESCDIFFSGQSSLSRQQCEIVCSKYDPNDTHITSQTFEPKLQPNETIWILKDGDPSKSKNSTNGNWLFAKNPFPVSDGLKFKAG